MNSSILSKSLKAKYYWGDKVPVSAVYECSVCGNYQAFKKAEFFAQCQDCINRSEKLENKWYFTNQLAYFVSKNTNVEFDKIASLELKIADKITEWAGTMAFIYFHILWFGFWVASNLGWLGAGFVFDPYPFGLLTMIVSLEAIFLATFIMISQNIYASKAELKSEHEYQMNLETEKNVAEILAILKDVKKDNEMKTETLTDSIEDIKDTIAEIAPDSLHETSEDMPTVDGVPLEAIEKEHFEEQTQILDEAGIDVIPESAPPVVLEEETKQKRKQRVIENKRESKKKSGSKSDDYISSEKKKKRTREVKEVDEMMHDIDKEDE